MGMIHHHSVRMHSRRKEDSIEVGYEGNEN